MPARRTGQCLCGAVSFTATVPETFHVCHCEMCRRWAGVAMAAVSVKAAEIEIEGAEHIRAFRSSEWASRCSCAECGSALWYRYDEGQDGAGDYEVALGLLDDVSGLELEKEIFFDEHAAGFELGGEHQRLTKAETLASFGANVEGS
ncbi:GFA family protein [Marinovum sp.]|uniref:GFA family protein n=1 Tax=Marinovum sp. TaxID=2024839 RepID=UPI002B26C964|nr:GFA family protein [Marinovum sp.]